MNTMIETIKKSVEEINDDFDSFRIVLTSVITHDTHRKKCLKELGALRNATLTSHLSLLDNLIKELDGNITWCCDCGKKIGFPVSKDESGNCVAGGTHHDESKYMKYPLVEPSDIHESGKIVGKIETITDTITTLQALQKEIKSLIK